MAPELHGRLRPNPPADDDLDVFLPEWARPPAEPDLSPDEIPAYEDFDTGLSFGDVARMLNQEARQHHRKTGQYMFVSRATVLGRWHEIKLNMYRDALRSAGLT